MHIVGDAIEFHPIGIVVNMGSPYFNKDVYEEGILSTWQNKLAQIIMHQDHSHSEFGRCISPAGSS